LIWLQLAAEAVSPVGIDGAVVSAKILTVTLTTVDVALFPDVSYALHVQACTPLLVLVKLHA
jgi:hypothetical protein